MVGVQQAAYVPMSRGHSYRWRVGRRQALKHNLTFPPHLELHCYASQREISPHQWIAAPNLFKGKLLTVPCISPLPLLNQAAGLAVFHAVGKARGGTLRSLWPIYNSLRSSDILRRWSLVWEGSIPSQTATGHRNCLSVKLWVCLDRRQKNRALVHEFSVLYGCFQFQQKLIKKNWLA